MRMVNDYFEANSFIEANIRFRDWKIEVRDMGGKDVLYVRVRVEDNFNKGKMIDLIHTRPMYPYPMSEAMFVEYLWEQMISILRHEAGEQLYVKGKLPYNEHDKMSLSEALK